MKREQSGAANPASKVDMVAKGVATGVAVSTIVQTGRGVAARLARNPLVMFGVGIAVGYFGHKYRKEIIKLARHTAEQGRDFASRQKDNLMDILAETEEKTGDPKN